MKLRTAVVSSAAVLLVCCTGTGILGGQQLMTSAAADCGSSADFTAGQPPPKVGDLSDQQVHNAAVIISVGQQKKLPARAWVIAIATALQESRLQNLGDLGDDNDHDSLGLFQQRPSAGWGTPAQILDPVYAAGKFYDKLITVKDWATIPLTEAAQAVQISAYPDAYAKHEPLATALVNALAGNDIDPADGTDALGATCGSDAGDGLPADGTNGIPDGFTLPSDAQQAAAVSFALAQLGKPYVFGAEGPDSYDCSGLMQAAWAKAGVRIPRVTGDQVHTGTAVAGITVMQPGDLIFIPGSDGTPQKPGHVGMYMGVGSDGRQWLVQAPHTGDVVKVTAVSSWASQIAAIRRPLTST